MSLGAEQISDILNKDKQAFYSWASNPVNRQRLNLPSGALRYFIPPRVYDFAQDPQQVRLIEWNKSDKTIDYFKEKHPQGKVVIKVGFEAKL